MSKLKESGYIVDYDFQSGTVYDYAIALGGDGTLLRVAAKVYHDSTPIIGINFGHIGFLSDGDATDLELIIEQLVNHQLKIEDRFTVNVTITFPSGETITDWAINDAVLEKAGVTSGRYGMMNVHLEIDHTPFTKFSCDGLIVSTATGSTAHAYSAGGSIIWPDVDCFEVIPIAAHTLFTRPIILGSCSELQLVIDESNADFVTLICDGQRCNQLPTGSVVHIKRSTLPLRFAQTSGKTFANKLVQKFHVPQSGWDS